MKRPAIDTLIKFLSYNPEFIEQSQKRAFFRAQYHNDLDILGDIELFQTFRPHALQLEQAGKEINPSLSKDYDLIIYLPTRFREENHYNCAKALNLLKPGGILICSLENDLGSDSMRDRLKQLAGEVESYSKNHCKVFYAKKTDALDQNLLNNFLELGNARKINSSNLLAAPGMFSWNKIDQGSILLADLIKDQLKGKVADLGSAYGFLSASALASNPKIDQIDLYEAELTALNLAKSNLNNDPRANYFWIDLCAEKTEHLYDYVITNPPFHVSKNADSSLGKRFILEASKMLKTGGSLFIVANQFLPYETTLETNFRACNKLLLDKGYKIFQAFK